MNRCAGVGCGTWVKLHRHCDACLTTAAIELARTFEARLLENEAGLDELDVRSALAGVAQTRPLSWYLTHSPLGGLSYSEAVVLRSKTDAACFLVARGGIAALRHLNEIPLPVPQALADPEEGEAPRPPKFLALSPAPHPFADDDPMPADYTVWGEGDVDGIVSEELARLCNQGIRFVGRVAVCLAAAAVGALVVGLMFSPRVFRFLGKAALCSVAVAGGLLLVIGVMTW